MLFHCQKRWTCNSLSQYLLKLQFNQANRARMECSFWIWKTKYRKLLEMCIAQSVKMKSLFTFKPIKLLVFTILKAAKPALTCSTFHSGNKSPHWFYLEEMVHVTLPKRRVATIERHLFAEKFSPKNTIYSNRTWTEKRKIHSMYVLNVGWGNELGFLFSVTFYNFNLYSRSMMFAVSNGGIQSFLDFSPDAVILTVKDLVKKGN